MMRKLKNRFGITHDDLWFFIDDVNIEFIRVCAEPEEKKQFIEKMLKKWDLVKDRFLEAWNDGLNVYEVFKCPPYTDGTKQGDNLPKILEYEKAKK